MTVTVTSIDEIRPLLGSALPPSPWLTVDQARVDAFAEVTGDHQWIHVDAERARKSAFGGTIAHGYLTLSLIPGLAAQIYRIEAGAARLNYGLDKMRFPAPVPVGSAVRLRATFVDLAERDSAAVLRVSFVVEIDGSDKPACIAESLTLLLP